MKRDTRDRAFSKEVRTRDGFTCQRCFTVYPENSKGLHCAHMFGRGKQNTRFDPENACALCYGCHRWLDTHPDLKRAFFIERLGAERFAALELRSNQTKKRMAS